MYAIRPPEYFPSLPFWALMLRCERFMLADTFQYSRQSFQNRARIRNPEGWQWITIPLKGRQHGLAIRDVEIDNTVPWRGKHFRALSYNYRSTPYFEFYEEPVSQLFEREWTYLGELTIASIALVAEMMRLNPPEIYEGDGDRRDDASEQELLLGSDEPELPGLRLRFEEPGYEQNFEGFEPGLSILDLLFNHGPEAKGILQGGITYPPDARNNGFPS
ncbi:MAG: WbqC family protein [Rhodothermales bacterium]